jgi:dTDP-4-dehydrorhamnose reductase
LRILVAGKNGQIGWELQRTLGALGEVTALGHAEMDLSKADAVRALIREIKPDIIVNAAAYTAVDKAESEPDLAMAVNGVAPGIMAQEAKRLGALLVHYSTDYVFDGTKCSPYTEDDSPNPLSVYGKTKLAGERAVTASGSAHLILRTSWVYSGRGSNFLLTILRLTRERDELRVVDDQVGAPTSSIAIAEATARILTQSATPITELNGIYHLSAAGHTTWFNFAKEIVELAGRDRPSRPKLIPISSEEYAAPAKRPRNSILDNTRFRTSFGFELPAWELSLKHCLAEYEQLPAV